ncbi:hypothetical protein ACU686_13695 [Yinghuangia aomiensis]
MVKNNDSSHRLAVDTRPVTVGARWRTALTAAGSIVALTGLAPHRVRAARRGARNDSGHGILARRHGRRPRKPWWSFGCGRTAFRVRVKVVT